jgi:hypothetical protein
MIGRDVEPAWRVVLVRYVLDLVRERRGLHDDEQRRQ